MTLYIYGGTIVNEGRSFKGSILIEDDRIANIIENESKPCGIHDKEIDATGCFVIPGIIDEHVHFREPGLTAKADIESESRAAAYGGVTSYFDMPNTLPQTTSIDALNEKQALAAGRSHVNYAFFYGATNHNVASFAGLDPHTVPGVKLFMGSSTGNMLVDRGEILEQIFAQSPLPVMTHCEDTDIISRNMKAAKAAHGDDPGIVYHPMIRSEEACYVSTALAVSLARRHGTRLHVAHLTTAKELELFGDDDNITAEAVIAHLVFSEADYLSLGTRIKCNPAVKRSADRQALRAALADGRIFTIGTDHAPHLLKDKEGGSGKAASGMPMIQFSLPTMLELTDEGVLSVERMVELMCHHPAMLFEVRRRGFLRKGYKADIAIVKPHSPWTVTKDVIQSRCGWSPMEGHTYDWRVTHTICNGHVVLDNGRFDGSCRGEAVLFR